MRAYWSLVCTAPALHRRIAYTVLGTSTVRDTSNSLIQMSHAITVPVRPVPGLQCTMFGPLLDFMCDLASDKNANTVPGSDGTPCTGQPPYHKCVTSRHRFNSMFYTCDLVHRQNKRTKSVVLVRLVKF